MADHAHCERIRMLLAEVGLDPERVICNDEGTCVVGAGMGDEGMPIEDIDRLTDKAIELAHIDGPEEPQTMGDVASVARYLSELNDGRAVAE